MKRETASTRVKRRAHKQVKKYTIRGKKYTQKQAVYEFVKQLMKEKDPKAKSVFEFTKTVRSKIMKKAWKMFHEKFDK